MKSMGSGWENLKIQLALKGLKDFYQGFIFPVDDQNKTPYVDLHSALMNTFSNDNYAFIILDGYVLALIKHINNCIYVFDSHARNEYVIPDDNCTAVVMKCSNIITLDQYLRSLSIELSSEFFEIMPVEFVSNTKKSTIHNLMSITTKICVREKTFLKIKEKKLLKKKD